MTHIFHSFTAILISASFIVMALWQSVPLRIFVVASGSMEPELSQGSLLITLRQSEYQVGEVVTYRSRTSDQAVTHRIMANKNGSYQTQGDANPTADPNLVRQNQIVGKVFFCVPRLGWPALWLNLHQFQLLKTWAVFSSQAQVQATSFKVTAEDTTLIKNGAFDTNLDYWQTQGNVWWERTQSPDETHLTGVASMTTEATTNQASVTQIFDLPQTVTNLSFWYRLDSTEDLLGLDEPTFEVQANGQTIYTHDWAQDGELAPSWRQVVIPTANLGPINSLSFKINATVDTLHPISVSLDAVSVVTALPAETPTPVFEPQTTFELHRNADTTVTLMIFSPLPNQTATLELATSFELRSAAQQVDQTTWPQAGVVPVTAVETWVDNHQPLSVEPLLVTAITFLAPPPETTGLGLRKKDAIGNQSAVISLIWPPT